VRHRNDLSRTRVGHREGPHPVCPPRAAKRAHTAQCGASEAAVKRIGYLSPPRNDSGNDPHSPLWTRVPSLGP
jgi:hypothetical protein